SLPDIVWEAGGASGAATATCAASPTASITSTKLVRGRLTLTGSAKDAGCPVRAVDVVLYTHAAHNQCRLVRANGRLSRAYPCAATPPASLVAHGTKAWTLRLTGKLARGSYTAYVRAVDKAGNTQKVAKRLTLKVH